MEYLEELKYYGQIEQAKFKLALVAKYIDQPQTIRALEDRWMFSNDRYY
jgi:hypothetical protein